MKNFFGSDPSMRLELEPRLAAGLELPDADGLGGPVRRRCSPVHQWLAHVGAERWEERGSGHHWVLCARLADGRPIARSRLRAELQREVRRPWTAVEFIRRWLFDTRLRVCRKHGRS